MWLRVSGAAALLAWCWLGASTSPQAPATPAAPVPLAGISDSEFAGLISSLSERGGSFPYGNFVSNETMISEAIGLIEDRPHSGGAYIGVGPEQNLSYIAALRPDIAFILDIRGDNLLQHLLYKAVTELSADRAEFLSRLFSRPQPPPAPYGDDLPVMLNLLRKTKSSDELFRRNIADVLEHLTVRRRLSLVEQDRRRLSSIYERFKNDGPDITYVGKSTQWPTFAEIVTDTDAGGVGRTFLASEARFQIVKAYHERNLIIPVVGNFAGPKALRAIGQVIRARGLVVRAFYLSNVEQYLFGDSTGDAASFYRNAETLPRDADSVMIRAIPPAPNRAPRNIPRYMPSVRVAEVTISISPIQTTLDSFRDRKLNSYLALSELGEAILAGSATDVRRLLASYATGTAVAVVPDDPLAFSKTFKRVAEEWIESAVGEDRLVREHSVALAVLETVRGAIDGEEGQWTAYKPLIEWTCDRLRHGPVSEFERDWMMAAVAIGARAGDGYFITDIRGSCKNREPCNQAHHGLLRFPDDRRFELAVLLRLPALRIASNRPGVPLDALMGKVVDTVEKRRLAVEALDNLLAELDGLAADPVAGPEAQLRAGVLRYNRHLLPRALEDFRAVASRTTDKEFVYLARLFSGLAYSALGKPEETLRELRTAVDTLPGARAASTLLASHLVQAGANAEGLMLMDAAFTTTGVDDPWYRFADLHWPAAIKRMRAALKR
jgi:tetratricopeptide (TPR) repeat protein